MRGTVYDGVSLVLLLGSVFFFYRAVEFLAQKDYVAGLVTFAIGFLIIRVGVEIGKLAILAHRDKLSP